MAIPTVLRTADLTDGDGITPSSLRAFLSIRQAAVALGWTIEFETLNEAIVFSNAGSGYMFRMYIIGSSTVTLYLQTAQSWTDINTPVNLLNDNAVRTDHFENTGDIMVVGDSSRFYVFFEKNTSNSSSSHGVRSMFVGDIVRLKGTDPYPFVLITDEEERISTSPRSSVSGRGKIYIPNKYITSLMNKAMYFFGEDDGTFLPNVGVAYGLLSPGAIVGQSSSIDFDNVQNIQPDLLAPTYVVRVDAGGEYLGAVYGNALRGILPGLVHAVYPSQALSNLNAFEEGVVAGVNAVALPIASSAGTPSMAITLNDWETLI